MKVAKILKAVAWLYFILAITSFFTVGIRAAIVGSTDTVTIVLYFVVGFVSSVIGLALIYGFANIVDYCETNKKQKQ